MSRMEIDTITWWHMFKQAYATYRGQGYTLDEAADQAIQDLKKAFVIAPERILDEHQKDHDDERLGYTD